MLNPLRLGRRPAAAHVARPARRPGRMAAGLIGGLLALLVAGTVTQPTSSAWTNGARFTATASTGTWSDSCVWVYVATGLPVTPAPACTITAVTLSPYYGAGIGYSDPTTGRAARFLVTFSPQATATVVPVITLRLNRGIIPADWAWSTSKLVSTQVTQTGTCTTLPSATGLKGLANYLNAELVLWEKASAGGGPTVCTGS